MLIPDGGQFADEESDELDEFLTTAESDKSKEASDDFVRDAEQAYDEAQERDSAERDPPDVADSKPTELTLEDVAELQHDLQEFAGFGQPPASAAGGALPYRLIRVVEIDIDPPVTQPRTLGLGGGGAMLFVLDRPASDRFRILRVPFAGGRGHSIIELEDGSADGGLSDPVGIAVGAEGQMHIPDAEDNCVKVFSADGRWLETFTSAGEQGLGFDHPRDVDVGDDGHLYIADTYNNRVVRLAPDGELVWEFEKFGLPGDGDTEDELYEPASVCLAGERLAIADTNQNRIVTVNRDAVVQSVLESDGTFEFPSEVRISEDGTLYVADHSNLRVQRFSPRGELNGLIDLRGDNDETSGGGDIEIDEDGHVVMIDPVREAVVVLGFVDP